MRNYPQQLLILIMVGVITFVGCSSSDTDEPIEEKTIIPTNTPKPKVECPQDEVDNYIEEIDLIFEEWDDTIVRAESTSRMSLSPVIGELQDIRRNIRRIDRPECADYINDVIIVAMERDIDSFISFLSQDSDSVVRRKMEGAERAWEIVTNEVKSFEESPIEAYESFAITSEQLEESLDEIKEFEKPEGWSEFELPNSDLIFSAPSDWNAKTYGDEDQYLELSNPDNTLTFLMGSLGEGGYTDLNSDSGRLFALQTSLETTDFDYYYEKSGDIEIQSKNKAYVVEFSVREDSGDDIEDRIWAIVITPDEDEILVIARTTRDQFAKIDLINYKTILGSFR